MVMRFPAKKNAGWSLVAQNHHAIFCQEQMATFFPPPVGLPGDSPPPPPKSVRADGRTLTSEPKFLGSIGFQISLPMVIRSEALDRKGAPLLGKFCASNFLYFCKCIACFSPQTLPVHLPTPLQCQKKNHM